MFDVLFLPQVFYTYFLRQGSVNPELFEEARLLNKPASKSRGSSHACLSVTGITDVCHHVTPGFFFFFVIAVLVVLYSRYKCSHNY